MLFKKKPRVQASIANASNARAQYRRRITSLDALEARLVARGWDPLTVELLDLSMRGAAVRLRIEDDRGLQVGDALDFAIGSMMRDEVVTAARVANVRADGANHLRYGLQFTELAERPAQWDDFYARYFNRRRHVRVRPSLDHRIQVTLRWDLEEQSAFATDISELGIGLTLPLEFAECLSEQATVELAFALPGGARPLQGRGVVRRCKSVGNQLLVGIQFDLEDERSSIAARGDELRTYICARTAECAQWERGGRPSP